MKINRSQYQRFKMKILERLKTEEPSSPVEEPEKKQVKQVQQSYMMYENQYGYMNSFRVDTVK